READVGAHRDEHVSRLRERGVLGLLELEDASLGDAGARADAADSIVLVVLLGDGRWEADEGVGRIGQALVTGEGRAPLLNAERDAGEARPEPRVDLVDREEERGVRAG